jgi:hypothetical protein
MTAYAIQKQDESKESFDLLWYAKQAIKFLKWFHGSAPGGPSLMYVEDHHTITPIPQTVYVGTIPFMQKVFAAQGIEVVPLGIIDPLRPFYGRRVGISTLGEAQSFEWTEFSVFVKSLELKVFDPVLARSHKDLILKSVNENAEEFLIPKETKIICSEVISLNAEYRFFILNGSIVGCQPYTHDWYKYQVNLERVKAMVKAWDTAPAAYTLDVGVLHGGETVLIEVNDFWSTGCYGFSDTKLLSMLSQRYFEIQRNKTTFVPGANSQVPYLKWEDL